MRMWLAAGIVVLACACLPGAAQAQSGCGGLLQPPCPTPTPAPTPEPTPAPTPAPTPVPAPPLSLERAAALEPLYAAAVKAFSTKATKAQERRYEQLCRRLTTKDTLLRDVRRHCIAEIASARAFACTTNASCVRALRRGATALTKEIAQARALGKTAARQVDDAACRGVIRISANDIRYLGILRTYARELSRAKSTKALDRAEAKFNRAARKLKAPRVATDRLTSFRTHCKS